MDKPLRATVITYCANTALYVLVTMSSRLLAYTPWGTYPFCLLPFVSCEPIPCGIASAHDDAREGNGFSNRGLEWIILNPPMGYHNLWVSNDVTTSYM